MLVSFLLFPFSFLGLFHHLVDWIGPKSLIPLQYGLTDIILVDLLYSVRLVVRIRRLEVALHLFPTIMTAGIHQFEGFFLVMVFGRASFHLVCE